MEQMKEKWWSTYIDDAPQIPRGETWLLERHLRACQKKKNVLNERFWIIRKMDSSEYFVPHFLIQRFQKKHGKSEKQLCKYWKEKHNNPSRTLMMKNRNLGASNFVPSKNKPTKPATPIKGAAKAYKETRIKHSPSQRHILAVKLQVVDNLGK